VEFDDRADGPGRNAVDIAHAGPAVGVGALIQRIFRLGGGGEASQDIADILGIIQVWARGFCCSLVAKDFVALGILPQNADDGTVAGGGDAGGFSEGFEAVKGAALDGEGFCPIAVEAFAAVVLNEKSGVAGPAVMRDGGEGWTDLGARGGRLPAGKRVRRFGGQKREGGKSQEWEKI
jgi:hypothetical protein